VVSLLNLDEKLVAGRIDTVFFQRTQLPRIAPPSLAIAFAPIPPPLLTSAGSFRSRVVPADIAQQSFHFRA
jgi:hypothetical protein